MLEKQYTIAHCNSFNFFLLLYSNLHVFLPDIATNRFQFCSRLNSEVSIIKMINRRETEVEAAGTVDSVVKFSLSFFLRFIMHCIKFYSRF